MTKTMKKSSIMKTNLKTRTQRIPRKKIVPTKKIKKTMKKINSSSKKKISSNNKLLNNNLSFKKDVLPFYYGLRPKTRKNLQTSLKTTHDSKPYISMRKLYVGPSAVEGVRIHGGRGVFAGEKFKQGDVVEICPLLLDNDKNWESPQKTDQAEHENYTISWDCDWFAVEEKMGNAEGKDGISRLGPEEKKKKQQKLKVHTSKGPSEKEVNDKYVYVPNSIAKDGRSRYGIQPHSGIMLGYGSLYNHGRKNANVQWEFGADGTVCFVARRNIHLHEELLVDYGDEYWMDMLGEVPDS